jgi:hypothetical protein
MSPSTNVTLVDPSADPFCSVREGERVGVHADDLALRPDEGGGQQGDVPNPAPYVQDAHAGADARRREQSPGQAPEEYVLLGQATAFLLRMPKRVDRVAFAPSDSSFLHH